VLQVCECCLSQGYHSNSLDMMHTSSIVIKIAKVKFFFQFKCQNRKQKFYSKNVLIIVFGFYRVISTQKHLTYSIPNNKVKVMRSFVLGAIEIEKTYKAIFLNSIFKIFKIK